MFLVFTNPLALPRHATDSYLSKKFPDNAASVHYLNGICIIVSCREFSWKDTTNSFSKFSTSPTANFLLRIELRMFGSVSRIPVQFENCGLFSTQISRSLTHYNWVCGWRPGQDQISQDQINIKVFG